MQPRFDPADNLFRIDSDVMGITERLCVNDLEYVTQQTRYREIDGKPFDVLPELGQKQRATGHLQPAQRAAGWREFQPVAIENRAPAGLADRLQPLQIMDC